MRDMTFAGRASDAALAARKTRDRALLDAHDAFWHDFDIAWGALDQAPLKLTGAHVSACRTALLATLAHLGELARLIAQRDGYDEAQSIGPDVAR
jgi:hypothetical protein